MQIFMPVIYCLRYSCDFHILCNQNRPNRPVITKKVKMQSFLNNLFRKIASQKKKLASHEQFWSHNTDCVLLRME